MATSKTAKTAKKNPPLNLYMNAAGLQKVATPLQDTYEPSVAQGNALPPLESALHTLREEIGGAHSAVENLYCTLQPFLPRHLFEEKDGGSEDTDELGYSENDSNLSPTVLEVRKALNEVLRLQHRLQFINCQVVR